MDQARAETELQRLFQSVPKAFANAILGYSQYMSGPLAVRMLDQIGLAEDRSAPFTLLDNGCGGGIVANLVQNRIPAGVMAQSKVICGDISKPMIEIVKQRIQDEGWVNTEAKVIDAQEPGLEPASLTHLTMNIGFHVVPDAEKALNESLRLLKPGGMLGFTTWHKSNPGWLEDVREAFASFDFEAPFSMSMQTNKWGDWPDVNWVEGTLEERGLQDVKVDVLSHLVQIQSPEEFITVFSMMIEFVITANWSDEQKKEHPKEEVLELVKKFLEAKYKDKPWKLTWTSIIASGRVPS